MRLQLIGILILICVSRLVNAQSTDSSKAERPPVDVNFLLNYYEQDGIHSAVTGGTGTEELTDFDGQIIAYVPFDSASSLTFQLGVNYYTSASSDRIDSRVSSASRHDARAQGYMSYRREFPMKHEVSVGLGSSVESDYVSKSATVSYSKSSKKDDRSITFSASAFLDNWVVIFPEELRAPGVSSVPTDRRRSYSLNITGQQIISRKTQAEVAIGLALQEGLLSTPFHRVYFNDIISPRIEKLPTKRWKVPISARLHHFIGGGVMSRLDYRFYYDSFGILAHSAMAEFPIRISPAFSVAPFFRYHTQTASDFFAPHAEHDTSATYYTSDYDLSGFSSIRTGLGVVWGPVNGLIRWKMPFTGKRRSGYLREIGLRGSIYRRSDGLNAWMIAMNLAFRAH